MLPRVSLRKIFSCVLLCGGIGVLLLSLHRVRNRNQSDALDPTAPPKLIDTGDAKTTTPSTSKTQSAAGRLQVEAPNRRLWFFSGGQIYPERHRGAVQLFGGDQSGDRVLEQLMYVPEDYEDASAEVKVILVYQGLGVWGQKSHSIAFHGCPVNRCSLTSNRDYVETADAILFKDSVHHSGARRPPGQLWILYHLECPYHTSAVKFHREINWTATYRRDSDLVTPYERWTYYNPEVKFKEQNRNYAANKTKQVAWFVSNCNARNDRLAYARELSNYISVDIYGSCGPLRCQRADNRCYQLLEREYKFYLAFENSNCRDYITEKLYVNGLGHAILPIAMGARPEDYESSAPTNSYIHVDDFDSPKELAEYLLKIDKDDDLYNSYFRWKGTGEFINTYFWCRLCAMLHAPYTSKNYEDINEWWRSPGTCTTRSWQTIPT